MTFCSTPQVPKLEMVSFYMEAIGKGTLLLSCIHLVYLMSSTVHDMENLTFSADYRAGNLHIAAQPSTYVRADN